MRLSTLRNGMLCSAALVAASLSAAPAFADDAPAAAPTPPAPYLKVTGHIDAGVTFNADQPGSNLNWGHLFTDRAGQPLLNQAVLTVEHDIDSSSKSFNWGFKIQGQYGADSRYTHILGIFNHTTSDINQFDIVEAHLDAHFPIIASGGVDVKAGIYPTLEGAEVMDATGNFFYSHNYIFNFGVPLKHTGVMTVTHFSHGIDIYAGVDSGVNTTFGLGGDTNGAPAFHGGIGFTIGKNITVLATTHIGPEDARGSLDFNNKPISTNSALRYLNDVVITTKLGSKLTSLTDINYIHDDGYNVSGGGISEQLVYTVNDHFSVGARAEVWDDGNGYFVSAFPGNQGFVANAFGYPNASGLGVNGVLFAPGVDTTYGEITVGLNWKPKVPTYTKNFSLTIRPEARYDAALNNTKVFDLSNASSGFTPTRHSQFTLGIDGVITF
jgi:hypothetical protein